VEKLTEFEKQMSNLLRHLLEDESPYGRSVDGDTISDATCDYICACEEFGIEEEALEFVKSNRNLTIEELDAFFDEMLPDVIVEEIDS